MPRYETGFTPCPADMGSDSESTQYEIFEQINPIAFLLLFHSLQERVDKAD